MSFNTNKIAPKPQSNFKRPDALDTGSYPARLVAVYILGIQPQRPYMGEDKPPALEAQLTYELSDEFLLDEEGNEDTEKPRWLSETIPVYSLDSDRAKSTQRYMVLDPNVIHEGDWSMLIGTPCHVQVTKAPSKRNPGQEVNYINSISSMRKKDADRLPELVNEPRLFSIYEEDDKVVENFKTLPDWMKEKIQGSLDFSDTPLGKLLSDGGAGKAEAPVKEVVNEEIDPDEEDQEAEENW